MPARGDHDARRKDLSEAVWRVVAARGFTGLTMRAVAAEMGASTGLVTHYFAGKAELIRYAIDMAVAKTEGRPRPAPEAEGIAALRAAMLHVAPTTPESAEMNRVWVGFWDLALGDPEHGGIQRDRYVKWRARLRGHAEDAQRRGELPPGDPDDVAASAAAFTHGLVTQALFDPERFPPERQTALIDRFLEGLKASGGAAGTA